MITQALYQGPPRGYSRTRTSKRYVVIHCTANDAPAANEAAYARRRTDNVSSHYYADRASVVQSLDTALGAWHAGSSVPNAHGIAWEFTGPGGASRAWWLANVAWDKVAAQMARDCRAHDIEPRDLDLAAIKAGKASGFITHNECRLVWGGTDHVCPGPGFPLDHLIAKVRAQMGKPAGPPAPSGGGVNVGEWNTDGVVDNWKWRPDAKTNTKVRPAWAVWLGVEEAHGARMAAAAADAKLTALTAQVAALSKVLAAVLAGVNRDDLDEAEVARLVLAGLPADEIARLVAERVPAETIAAAIPADLAQRLVDLLVARLAA